MFFIIADFTISHLVTLSLHVQNLPVSRRFFPRSGSDHRQYSLRRLMDGWPG